MTFTDVVSPGFGDVWSHARVYANKMDQMYDSGNGFGWYIPRLPYAGGGDDRIAFVFDPNNPIWFVRSGTAYTPMFAGTKYSLTHDVANYMYLLRDQQGRLHRFNDFSAVPQLKGFYASLQIPGGQTTAYNYDVASRRVQSVVRHDPASGVTETIAYTYFSSGVHQDRIQYLTVSRQVGGTMVNVRRVVYVYYEQYDPFGNENDLKTATVQSWNGAAWIDLNTKYYRYYVDWLSNGFPHGLKYALDPEAFERLSEAVANPFNATTAQVSAYADYYFEYSADLKVTLERVQGAVCGQAHGAFGYVYSQSTNADDVNHWKTKVVETLPNGDQNTLYINNAGQTMLKEFRSGTSSWIDYYQFGANGKVVLQASPSAVIGYSEGSADLAVNLRASAGLIRLFAYYTTTGGVGAENNLQSESVQQGSGGTPTLLRSVEYHVETAADASYVSESKVTVYRNDDGSGAIVTQFDYQFYSGTVQVQQKTTTLPVVSTAQNGSGIASTRVECFDPFGYSTWSMGERGVLTRTQYDTATGSLLQRIDDVDTSQVTDAPTGWSTQSGFGLHAVTDYQIDALGRTTQSLGPAHEVDLAGVATTVRSAAFMLYLDAAYEMRFAAGYATGSSPGYSYFIVNPVSIRKMDQANRPTETIQATRASTSAALSASDVFSQSSYVRWTVDHYNDQCQQDWRRVYYAIPASGAGTAAANYNETDLGYDAMGRQNRAVSPGGTITRTVFEARGLPTAVYVGTNDAGATDADPTGGGATGNDMVQTQGYVYDGGAAGGDGLVTQRTMMVDANTANDRIMIYGYDFRDRRISIQGPLDYYQATTRDNLDRVVQMDRRNTNASGNLIARGATAYDDRGRVFQTTRYAVDPATGTVGNGLLDNAWYDPAGNVVKRRPVGAQAFTKMLYDGLGRAYKQYLAYGADASYPGAGSVANNTVVEQTETTYDLAGNRIQSTLRRRFHTATGLGELTFPTGTQPLARVAYTAFYSDGAGRPLADAVYGTNGGSAFVQSSTVPARSDAVLVTSTGYDGAGMAFQTIDPAGREDREYYDHAGRRTQRIANYSATGTGADQNITVNFTYTPDDGMATIIAVNATTGDQTTRYVYGSTLTESGVARTDLLRAEVLPDSDDTANPPGNGPDGVYDRIEYTSNRQGVVVTRKDQNATVRTFLYDALGRPTHDCVTTLGSGVNASVMRISTTYDVRGLTINITSHDNATVGAGTVVNDVQCGYNAFGQVINEYQSHSGAVAVGTTPQVQYGYADGSTNTVRQTSLTYPNGRVLTYDYGAAGGGGDALSRLQNIVDAGPATLAAYTYLGAATIAQVDYAQPQVRYDLAMGTGADPYSGLDSFDRIVDNRWWDYQANADVDRQQHDYDRASNCLLRRIPVDPDDQHDELYAYDGMYRLTSFQRGTLNSGRTAITALTFAQGWNLDPTGNWTGFKQNSNGGASWDLDQTRTSSKENEISGIAAMAGTTWAAPAYDLAGNMTFIPKPISPTAAFSGEYDAWNRMVKLGDGATVAQAMTYDGSGRRSWTQIGTAEPEHTYFTASWRAIETRLGAAVTAQEQYIFGIRYIDDVVRRDRDVDGTGVLTEMLYAIQDMNWNVTCIINETGTAEERIVYDAYGVATFLSGEWISEPASNFEWNLAFAGAVRDEATGLYHMRFRTYSPTLGAWLSRDFISSTNLYWYVENAPINSTDPFGLDPDLTDPDVFFKIYIVKKLRSDLKDSPKNKKEINEKNNKDLEDWRKKQFRRGCIGVVQCLLGDNLPWPDLSHCYKGQGGEAQADTEAGKWNADKVCCEKNKTANRGCTDAYGKDVRARVMYLLINERGTIGSQADPKNDPNRYDLNSSKDAIASHAPDGETNFDVSIYDNSRSQWIGANYGGSGMLVKFRTVDKKDRWVEQSMRDSAGVSFAGRKKPTYSAIYYCVVCSLGWPTK